MKEELWMILKFCCLGRKDSRTLGWCSSCRHNMSRYSFRGDQVCSVTRDWPLFYTSGTRLPGCIIYGVVVLHLLLIIRTNMPIAINTFCHLKSRRSSSMLRQEWRTFLPSLFLSLSMTVVSDLFRCYFSFCRCLKYGTLLKKC